MQGSEASEASSHGVVFSSPSFFMVGSKDRVEPMMAL